MLLLTGHLYYSSQGSKNLAQELKSGFTVKATSANLIVLSKFLATLQAQFTPISVSRIIFSHEKKTYYAYLNFNDSEIAEKLQEVSAFPEAK
jgi:hypothetical protein